jgi:hypothetical protein
MSDLFAVIVMTVLLLCVASFCYMEYAWRKILHNIEQSRHRRLLSAAAFSGDTSVEYWAMCCAWCGQFHSWDEEECMRHSSVQ